MYLVDNIGNCYKQEFTFDEIIVRIDNSLICYKEIPKVKNE